MISVEGDFVRTWRYGRRRIRHKARKYRRFGGVRIILDWHTDIGAIFTDSPDRSPEFLKLSKLSEEITKNP